MSTATTKQDSAQDVGGAKNAPGEGQSNGATMSVEDVERAASQFKPAWEAESFDAFDAAALAGETPASEPAPAGLAEPAPPPAAPLVPQDSPPLAAAQQPASLAAVESRAPDAPIEPTPHVDDHPPSSQSRKLELVDASAETGNDQGPVDIVADIPKRTEVQFKDEPSVVVADELERKRPTVPPPARSRASKPVPAVAAPVDDEPPVARQSRNRKIVIGVVAVAGLLVVAAGIRMAFQSDDTPKPPDAPSTVAPSVATHATPTATAVATPEPTPERTAPPPPETAAVAVKEPPAATTPEPVETKPPPAPPAETPPPASAHAKAPPKSTTTTTAASPPPATTKPPAPPPAKTEQPAKPPSGGIVRETPF